MIRPITTEQFIQKALLKHGTKFDYSDVDYSHSTKAVRIKCHTHGEFLQAPKNHLYGSGCPMCARASKANTQKKTTAQFISKAVKVHNGKYDYSMTQYTGVKNAVDIICPQHGKFTQRPDTHLQGSGCTLCGRVRTNNNIEAATRQFILKARAVHGTMYSYSQVKYVRVDKPVEILCRAHGQFKQIPHSHLKGSGCPRCSIERSGWHYSNWLEAGLRSRHFDSFKVYILRCWNVNEEFIKIGKTFRTISGRFPNKSRMPYNYEILHVESCTKDARKISEIEHELQRALIKDKYIPRLSFHGSGECFSLNVIGYLKKRFPVCVGLRNDK